MQAIISYPKKKQEAEALKAFMSALKIKFEEKESNTSYSPEFIAKIEESKKQVARGEYVTIKDTQNIWESILSK